MKLRILLCLLAVLMLGACATDSGYYRNGYGYDRGYDRSYSGGYANCYDCGVVERIETLYGADRPSGAGAVLGGVVGGALGSQVGSGSGRTAATVAGAVAGGVAGHEIERRQRTGPIYEVHVRMDNGRMIVVDQRNLGGVRPGARVRIINGEARLL